MRLALFLFLVFGTGMLLAQDGNSNPFELPQPSSVLPSSTKIGEDVNLDNPFEITNASDKLTRITTLTNPTTVTTKQTVQEKPLSFKMAITFSTIIVLGILMTFFRGVYRDFWESAFRDRKFNQFYRRINFQWIVPNALLFIYAVITISIFLYLVSSHWGYIYEIHSYKWIGLIALGYASYFVIKHVLLTFVGNTFDISNETSRYSLLAMTFNIVTSIFITPINLLLLLGPSGLQSIAAFVGVTICCAMCILFLLRALSVANRFILRDILHFFVYLCTLEIAPLAIIFKLLG